MIVTPLLRTSTIMIIRMINMPGTKTGGTDKKQYQ